MEGIFQSFNLIVDVLTIVLNFFNRYLNSYGLSIIFLTIVIRIVLLPLSVKQIRSMQEMQKIQPKLKKLQEKYKNDKEKQQKEMMKFYSENKINPFGGCLPLLLQLPIFWALFRMLLDSDQLNERFLWIPNLSKHDPLYILIALMVFSMYYSQKMVTKDPSQMKMMLPMSAFMVFIAIRLPAGVMIYWVTTNVWQIAQQYITLKLSPEKGGG